MKKTHTYSSFMKLAVPFTSQSMLDIVAYRSAAPEDHFFHFGFRFVWKLVPTDLVEFERQTRELQRSWINGCNTQHHSLKLRLKQKLSLPFTLMTMEHMGTKTALISSNGVDVHRFSNPKRLPWAPAFHMHFLWVNDNMDRCIQPREPLERYSLILLFGNFNAGSLKVNWYIYIYITNLL